MAGRDEEFQARLEAAARARANGEGAVDLSALAQGPPDPRQFPVTLTEVTFRQSWHKWERIMDEEGNVLHYRMLILDPQGRTVYYYGFDAAVLDGMISDLTAMRDEPTLEPTVEPGSADEE